MLIDNSQYEIHFNIIWAMGTLFDIFDGSNTLTN